MTITFPKSDDPLAEVLNAPLASTPKKPPASYNGGVPEGKLYERPCHKCGGSGRFIGYSGRSVGSCFTCKGTGKLTTKTDRVKAGVKKAAKKARTAAENLEAFKLAEPAVFAWFDGSSFPFAIAMKEAVQKWGSLTERQMEACKRSVEKLAAAKQARVERVTQAPSVNVGALEEAFAKARVGAKKAPRLIIAGFKVSPAGANSANPGALYVTAGSTYLGKITGGKFLASRDCDEASTKAVLELLADPKAAAIKAGRLTGICAVCARELTDPESIAAGIGPVCAGNFGW